MITPEVMAALKSTAQRVGDLNLEALQKVEAHVYVDLAILAYMFHVQVTACTRCKETTAEQVIEMLQVIDEVSAYARTECENTMREMGMLKASDG